MDLLEAAHAADRGNLRPAQAFLAAGAPAPSETVLRGFVHLAGLGARPALPPIAPGTEATESSLLAASVVALAALLAGDRASLTAACARLRFAAGPAGGDS